MHNRLSSKLRAAPSGGLRAPITPRVGQQQQPQQMTPNLRTTTSYNPQLQQQQQHQQQQQQFLQQNNVHSNNQNNNFLIKQALDDLNGDNFKVLNEIMHSIIIHSIQIYQINNNMPLTFRPTSNEQQRIAELTNLFTNVRWMSLTQALVDSLSVQPPQFWSNLQQRLITSEGTIVAGFYSLPLSDIKSLYGLLERSSPANYLVIQQQLLQSKHLQAFHHPQFKPDVYYQNQELEKEAMEQQQQQQQQQQQNINNNFNPTNTNNTQQQYQQLNGPNGPVVTNVNTMANNNNTLDFGASPILNRQSRKTPVTPAFQPTQQQQQFNANFDDSTVASGQVDPGTPQRYMSTPNRLTRGFGTPGRINLRQPLGAQTPKLNNNNNNNDVNNNNNKNTQTDTKSNDPISQLDELPLPTVGDDVDVDNRDNNDNQQQNQANNNHANNQVNKPANQNFAPRQGFQGLQSPIRRTANSFITPTLQRYGQSSQYQQQGYQDDEINNNNNKNNINNDDQQHNTTNFSLGGGNTNHRTPTGPLTNPINRSTATVQYHQSTAGNCITVGTFQPNDYQEILEQLSNCGQIRNVQRLQAIQRNTTTSSGLLRGGQANNNVVGRLIIEYDSPHSANLALQRAAFLQINGRSISITPFAPQHAQMYSLVSNSGPYTRTNTEKATILQNHEDGMSNKQLYNGTNNQRVHNPSHVFQHLYDSEQKKRQDDETSKQIENVKDLAKYSLAIFFIILLIVKVLFK